MRKWRNINSIRVKVIFLSAILSMFCAYNLTYSKNRSREIQLSDKILSLSSSDNDEAASTELLALLSSIEKSELNDEELISIYSELLDYYIGEGPGELLSEKITKIGEKILPFLVEKLKTKLKCSEKYRSICYQNIKERNLKIIHLIDAIKKGIVLYAEYPENLKIEAEKNMHIIRIFLDDYKMDTGKFPIDLNTLREHVWKKYAFKLIILNPWGQPLKYMLQKDGKYILKSEMDQEAFLPKN